MIADCIADRLDEEQYRLYLRAKAVEEFLWTKCDADAAVDALRDLAAGRGVGDTSLRLIVEDARGVAEEEARQLEQLERAVNRGINRALAGAYDFTPLSDFLEHPYPEAVPLLGEPGAIYLAVGTLMLVYGAAGAAKSTWTVDGIAHMAAGREWLGIPVPRPVRFLVIENEGPPSLFQAKLAEKAATWDGDAWTQNVSVYQGPWGRFTFADPGARAALSSFCDEHEIDVVTANPMLGLGVSGSGRPDETNQFVSWLKECGLGSTRAFWLVHHENKAGQVSGDWDRHSDTNVHLARDGKEAATLLDWRKTRWATLESQRTRLKLEWVLDSKGYRVVELATDVASDDELDSRIVEFLAEHPWTSTSGVLEHVQGGSKRLRERLKSGLFDSVSGERGATLWNVDHDPDSDPDVGVTGEELKPA